MTNIKKNSVGVLILSYNGLKKLTTLISFLLEYKNDFKILVIDSSSNDGTIEYLKNKGINVVIIPKLDFNHGATREFGRQMLNTDIVVMLTQDILPLKNNFIENLVAPIVKGEAVATYGRQLPRMEAGMLESIPRLYNYPNKNIKKTFLDIDELGVFCFFFSDSFSAYLNSSLEKIGGFKATLTWEDYYTVARLLINGYNVEYVAEATVIHSHNYSLIQEFQRYFDAGYVRSQNRWLNKYISSAEKRGVGYLKYLVKTLYKGNKYLIPYAIIQSAVKWFAYRLGTISLSFPRFVNKLLSGQKYYWYSKYFSKKVIDL